MGLLSSPLGRYAIVAEEGTAHESACVVLVACAATVVASPGRLPTQKSEAKSQVEFGIKRRPARPSWRERRFYPLGKKADGSSTPSYAACLQSRILLAVAYEHEGQPGEGAQRRTRESRSSWDPNKLPGPSETTSSSRKSMTGPAKGKGEVVLAPCGHRRLAARPVFALGVRPRLLRKSRFETAQSSPEKWTSRRSSASWWSAFRRPGGS